MWVCKLLHSYRLCLKFSSTKVSQHKLLVVLAPARLKHLQPVFEVRVNFVAYEFIRRSCLSSFKSYGPVSNRAVNAALVLYCRSEPLKVTL